jgi:hypothetical protein
MPYTHRHSYKCTIKKFIYVYNYFSGFHNLLQHRQLDPFLALLLSSGHPHQSRTRPGTKTINVFIVNGLFTFVQLGFKWSWHTWVKFKYCFLHRTEHTYMKGMAWCQIRLRVLNKMECAKFGKDKNLWILGLTPHFIDKGFARKSRKILTDFPCFLWTN